MPPLEVTTVLAERQIDRRAFLADLGRGAFAIAIVSIAGCAPRLGSSPAPTSGRTASGTSGPGPSPAGGPAGSSGTPTAPAGGSLRPAGGVAWERVNLGFVSAYLLVRDGEAALVDTGVAGSADAIEDVLGSIGLGWSAVAHAVLTHHHQDHAGSIETVLTKAPAAVGYAGAEDIPSISAPRPLTAVGDGDRVFDLQIITSPGHTAGSISVLDPIAGVLVVGDAMGTSGGKPTPPGDQFTVDMGIARQSIAKLGALTFETLLVGHGDPIESGASGLVSELASAG
jgi:glyoxylase-like metal-dependent hydrolase (beta-lactamase superfamily II)